MVSTIDDKAANAQLLMEVIRAQTEIAQLGMDLGGVMAFVAERVQQLTGASGAIVELAEGDEMVYRAASGMAANQLGLRLNRSGSLSGLCVAERQVLRCEDPETDPRVDKEACRRVGIRSMLVAPLNHGETTVGALKLASPEAGVFTDDHVRILELMCSLIAAAMYHSVQHETSALYHKATHDALTGLANRALFLDRLRQGIGHARRRSGLLGLLSVDMDGLKPINDTHGHRAGDAAICEAGRRMRAIARQTDTVARMGGDEFAIIMTDVDCRDSVRRHADLLVQEIGRPFHFEEKSLPMGASVGVATFPEDGNEIEHLIEKADQAMYSVKRTRKTHRA